MTQAMLPPLFQILTGLSFAALLVIRFFAAPMLRPVWGKLIAFGGLFVALGNFLLSFATAESSISAGADFFAYAGASLFVAVLLVVAGSVIAVRQGAGVSQS